ncbi:hypothetical protein ACHAWT_008023 [Skeletonema menzelii]
MSYGAPFDDYYRRLIMAAAAASGQEQEHSRETNFYWWPQPQQHQAPSASGLGSGQAPPSYEAIVKAYLEKYPPTNGEDTGRRRDEDVNEHEASKRRMVQWRGNYVSETEAKALRHVFDDMKDHFGHNLPDPDVCAVLKGLSHLGGGRDTIWEGELDFIYNIGGERCRLAYVGMEICLDLTPKLVQNERGRPMLRDYGKSWVYAYLPEITMLKVKQYIRAGTGWEISEEGIFQDPNCNLVAIEAMMHDGTQQPKPSFSVVEDYDATDFRNSSSFTRIGSVQTVYQDTDQQQIHRGIGFFCLSVEIDGSSSTVRPVRGAKGVDDEATLIFTLISFSTWGITDSIAPIVFNTPPYY